MNAINALALLKESMATHGLGEWSAQLDNSKRRFGVCKPGKKTISISRPLCALNSDDEVRDTILHEISHALAWKRHGENCGHDARWKKICAEVGARPVACYDGNDVTQPDAPWVLAHKETGEVFRSYFKRPNRNWSEIWIRGRKADTFGKLEIRPNDSQHKSAVTEPEHQQGNSSINLESFDKQTVEKMRYEALLQLKAFAKERGIEVELTRTKYSAVNCEITFQFKQPTPEGIDRQKLEFSAAAFLFNLTEEDYLREFVVNGGRYRLCGIKPENRKYPIIAKDDRDQRYKFPETVLDKLK